MDPDLQALLEVTRGHTKSARRQLSTLARLLAELDEQLAGLETNAQPKEAQRDGNEQDT